MSARFQIPLDIPNVKILSVKNGSKGEFILSVESTLHSTHCQHCKREISDFHGFGKPIRLQHLPILERVVYVEIRPKRYRCPHCNGRTTTQRLDWYESNSPHTKAFDQWLLRLMINSTVSDVSRRAQVSRDKVEGAIKRQVTTSVDWSVLKPMATLGLDEIALRKGHKNFVCIVSALNEQGKVIVLAVLPDRLKQTVFAFLDGMPAPFKAAVKHICSDMYDGFVNAAKEALPHASIVIDRFHVAQQYGKATDSFRKQISKDLKQTLDKPAYDKLKGCLWAFRRHFWDLSDEEMNKLLELLKQSPELEQAWLLRHELHLIYQADHSPQQAQKQFETWVEKARSISCFDGFIKTFEKYKVGILAYFDGRHSSGFVEGLNNKLKIIKRRCFGLIDPTTLFQRIQIDLQDRIGDFSKTPPTICSR